MKHVSLMEQASSPGRYRNYRWFRRCDLIRFIYEDTLPPEGIAVQ
jgi:hypothetical protein